MSLTRICAWRGKHLGGPPEGSPESTDVSHGICEACYEREMAKQNPPTARRATAVDWSKATRIDPRDIGEYDIAWLDVDGSLYSLPDGATHIDIACAVSPVYDKHKIPDEDKSFDVLMYERRAARVYITGGYHRSGYQVDYSELGIGYSGSLTVQQLATFMQLYAIARKRGGPVSAIWTNWDKVGKKDVQRAAGVSMDALLEHEGARRPNPPQPDSVLNKFLDDIASRGEVVSERLPTEYHRGYSIAFGPVTVRLVRNSGEGRVELATIESWARGHGHASAVLDLIRSVARQHHVDVLLVADPFGHERDEAGTKRLGKGALRDWYRRHGFRGYRGGMLQRNPIDVRPEWQRAVEAAWGVRLGALLGKGAYGAVYDIGGHRVVKITKGAQEGAATNLIRTFQRKPGASASTPARIAYPEILRCAELIGHGIPAKQHIYVIERESGLPLEATEYWRRFHTAAYHAFTKISDAADLAVSSGNDDEVGSLLHAAVRLMPESKQLADALVRMARIGFITGDLHQGNIGVREVSRPGWPQRGQLFVMDYGINVIRREDEREYQRFRSIAARNPEYPLPDWPKIVVD